MESAHTNSKTEVKMAMIKFGQHLALVLTMLFSLPCSVFRCLCDLVDFEVQYYATTNIGKTLFCRNHNRFYYKTLII